MEESKQKQSTEEQNQTTEDVVQKTEEQAPFHNAPYTISFTDEGVFLDVGVGSTPNTDCLVYDVIRRGIEGVKPDVLRSALRRNSERFRLADPQEQKKVDSDVAVVVPKDEMTAYMMLLPPVNGGEKLSADAVIERIQTTWGIVYGLDEQLIRRMVDEDAYFRYEQIAQGKPPQKGKDGSITFNFDTSISYAPTILPDGSADYKNLKLFEHVKEGDVLVVAIPPEDGIDGITVKGKTLPAQRGKEKKLPKGKNVAVSEDGLSLIAKKSGRVDYVRERVEVLDVYRVPGDVSMRTGNINFDGDVIVDGNVISGFSINATGTIEVRGYVEAATLTAGKDIVLRNGMQGMSQGVLTAERNIVARFIERATLTARGDITADYIVQCITAAGNKVELKGKWGKLLGGTTRAGREITANVIGSPAAENTQIELGILPDERVRYTKLDAERSKIKSQLNRIQNLTRMPATADISPERRAMRQKLIEAGEQLMDQYEKINEDLALLKEKLSGNSNARLNALRTVYPNVRIQIDTAVLVTKSEIDFATFRFKEGEVAFTACEVRG